MRQCIKCTVKSAVVGHTSIKIKDKVAMISIPLTPSNVYFWLAVCCNCIFVSVRIFLRLEDVAKVKIQEKAWKEAKVQEVTYAWVTTIRTFMSFRLGVLAVCLIMEEGLAKSSMIAVNFAVDLHLMNGIYTNFFKVGKDHKVILHRSPIPPLVIQASVVFAGMVYCGYSFFLTY